MKTLALIFISLVFISCSSKDEKVTKTQKQPTNQKNQIKNYQKPTPSWVLNPTTGVKYGAVGIAPPQKNKKLQRLTAIANGKRKLSEQFRLQLQKQAPAPFDTNSKMIGSTFNIVALQSSQNITKNATIKDSYTDNEGALYLWIVIY